MAENDDITEAFVISTSPEVQSAQTAGRLDYLSTSDVTGRPDFIARFPVESGSAAPRRVSKETVQSLKNQLSLLIDASGKLVQKCTDGDLIDWTNEYFEISRILQKLWTLRGAVDSTRQNWVDVLNLLQTTLRTAVPEHLALSQVNGIAHACRTLDNLDMDDYDVEQILELLSDGGINPFSVLANPLAADEESE